MGIDTLIWIRNLPVVIGDWHVRAPEDWLSSSDIVQVSIKNYGADALPRLETGKTVISNWTMTSQRICYIIGTKQENDETDYDWKHYL